MHVKKKKMEGEGEDRNGRADKPSHCANTLKKPYINRQMEKLCASCHQQ